MNHNSSVRHSVRCRSLRSFVSGAHGAVSKLFSTHTRSSVGHLLLFLNHMLLFLDHPLPLRDHLQCRDRRPPLGRHGPLRFLLFRRHFLIGIETLREATNQGHGQRTYPRHSAQSSPVHSASSTNGDTVTTLSLDVLLRNTPLHVFVVSSQTSATTDGEEKSTHHCQRL